MTVSNPVPPLVTGTVPVRISLPPIDTVPEDSVITVVPKLIPVNWG